MSLDVYLITKNPVTKKGTGIFIRKEGQNYELSYDEAKEMYPNYEIEVQEFETNEVFRANITHNLNKMASEAGIYEHLWSPEEIDITKANQLIEPLRDGLHKLKLNREYYEQFNPSNGWGTYHNLVNFVQKYLDACYEYPDADVNVWA